MNKQTEDKKHRSKYQEKIRRRKLLAHKYNLPDMPYPLLLARLELMGVDTERIKSE